MKQIEANNYLAIPLWIDLTKVWTLVIKSKVDFLKESRNNKPDSKKQIIYVNCKKQKCFLNILDNIFKNLTILDEIWNKQMTKTKCKHVV